jgi:hypothetical protein
MCFFSLEQFGYILSAHLISILKLPVLPLHLNGRKPVFSIFRRPTLIQSTPSEPVLIPYLILDEIDADEQDKKAEKVRTVSHHDEPEE